jgi:SAM-dependent methyltransferase
MRFLLEHPFFYELQQTLNGWYTGAQKQLVAEYVQPYAGQRVLDIGCAVGHMTTYLPEAQYVGLDLNPRYIAKAKQRHPDKTFMVEDAASDAVAALGEFDCVLLFGLLHHLTDEEATKLFATSRRLLAPGGKVISVDNCWYEGQSAFEQWGVRNDRGQYARTGEGYQKLALQSFSQVKVERRHGMLRFPYALLVMDSRA